MVEVIGSIAGVLAIAGVFLNNRKMIACFYVWFFSNGLSAYIHIDSQLYSLFARDIIFLILAVEGWHKWRSK